MSSDTWFILICYETQDDQESVCSSDDVIDETEMEEFITLHESACAVTSSQKCLHTFVSV